MTKERESFLVSVGRVLLVTIIATASATATASWTARGIVADFDRRITVVETKQLVTDTNVTTKLDNLQTDIRELRQLFIDSKARP